LRRYIHLLDADLPEPTVLATIRARVSANADAVEAEEVADVRG
jgi:hypothetical protein